MDDYPAASLDHNIPYVVLLGLPATSPASESPLQPGLRDQAVLLRSELPPVTSKHADAVLQYIRAGDATEAPWSGRDELRRYKFRVKSAGRTFLLPPRRARLPDDMSDAPQSPGALHSPFSPLSPSCRLYPDGIIDDMWLIKHQDLIPSVFLCFYELTADPTLATLHDNQIKTDINTIRNGLVQLGFKSRVAVAVLSDTRTSSMDGAQERLDNIRKGCSLDPKSFFWVPSPQSQEELERIADNMLATVYGQATEYYRELGRRARKKKSRGVAPQPTVPPTSGTSQTLSLSGWNARYDFKSAVFAEFRQEMDQALRSFELAYEALLGPDLLDMIPSWSPRWNEARQLADVISIRCLRCLLWNGQTSAAVRRWQSHRERIGDLIDRRGRGTTNYGWRAWEARWAVVMAMLIEKTAMPELAASAPTLFLPPERTVMGERLQPWEMLHHPGYWYRAASRHLFARRALAYAMPEDDRRPPDFSPASKVAGRAFIYDTYMCPEPHEEYPLTPNSGGVVGVDHAKLIIECLVAARREFLERGQTRLAAELALECSREYAATRQWPAVLDLLRPLWDDALFRAESWVDISEELGWLLRAAARQTGQAALLLAVDWDLLNRKYNQRRNWHYDLSRSLEGISGAAPGAEAEANSTDAESTTTDGGADSDQEKPTVFLEDKSSLPLLDTSFVFLSDEGKAGQTCQAQLAITSNAFPNSPPISLQSIRILFEGSLRTVWLKQSGDPRSPTEPTLKAIVSVITLQEESLPQEGSATDAPSTGTPVLFGSGDLTLLPGHTMVFEMGIPLREPGEAKASSVTLFMSCNDFKLACKANLRDSGLSGVWHGPNRSRKVSRTNCHSIKILPRPPNLEIKLLNPLDQYYTNEAIDLRFDIVNAEDADAVVKLDVILSGDEPPGFRLLVSEEEVAAANPDAEESSLLAVPLGTISTSEVVSAAVAIEQMELPTSYDLTLRASYSLVSDPATPIMQTAVFTLPLTNPFEANYDLLPRLNPDPWPSVFDPEGVEALAAAAAAIGDAGDSDYVAPQPRGLAQTWCLVTRYASFALEDLRVVDLDVDIAPTRGVQCRVAKEDAGLLRAGKSGGSDGEQGLLIKPKTIEEARFNVIAQRLALDERDPVGLDVSFVIRWSRLVQKEGEDGVQAVNTTRLPVPRLMIFGVEPRVLASVSYPDFENPKPDPPEASTEAEGEGSAAEGTSGAGAPGLVILDIVIENASNHFLTFGLNMEPSEEFAFSGPKMTTIHLLPVSRRSINYRLLPLIRGAWIRPNLTVRDKYFQKVLRVIPTEGMKLDKEGFLVWVPPLADDD